MAELSGFWDTDDTGDGPVAGYSQANVSQFFRSLTSHTANLGGVISDYLNELAVSGTSSPVSINTGAAVVYGFFYHNSASETKTISTPASLTRIDRIVLEVDWTAETVRIAVVAGTEGAGAPSLTQTGGTKWQIPLAQASITTGGVITVTDEREWVTIVGDGDITAAKLATDAVETAKIKDANVTADKLATDAVETAKIKDANVTADKLATDAVETAKIKDANVTAAKLATDAVETAKIKDANVTADKLAADAVTGDKIADGAVDPRAHIAGTNGIVVDSANGNSRGDDAVDLQTERDADTQVASGNYSSVIGGENNTASGNHAVAYGRGAAASLQGQVAHGIQSVSNPGQMQSSQYVLGRLTNDATPGNMTLNSASGGGRLTVPTGTTWLFDILVVARRKSANDESAAYQFVGCIDNNAGTTALVGSITKTVIAEDTPAWDVDVTANDIGDILEITVTGEAGKSIQWVAFVRTVEVTG